MKKFITFLLAAASAFTIHAQQEAPPQGINYQAVALDNSEKETVGVDVTAQPVAEKDIRVRFSILKTSENGPLTYREQHIVTTDIYGLFNAVIGQGTVDSSPIDFSQIDWGTGYHFLKVEIDITGGTNYKDMGTQQLWSVPYALYSKYASVAGNGIDSVTDNGNGTITFTYIDGSTYTTPTLTGLTGPQGEIGPQGPAGTDGQNGLSAYEIWLSQGNTGTESDFLNSLVGAQGIQGPIGAAGPQGPQGVQGIAGTNGLDGNGITSTIDNGNGTFTINYSNGTSFTTSNLTGPQGIQGPIGAVGPQGPQGVQGVQGIAGTNGLDGNGTISTVDNGNGTFTLNYSNGTSFTTSNLTGPQGIQGPIGVTGPQGVQGIAGTNGLDGNGIISTVDNGNGTFTLNYFNGTSFITSNLIGPQGIQGPIGVTGPQGVQGIAGTNGLDGNGIISTVDNGNGTFTLNYSNGTSFTTSNLTGPQGIQGSNGINGLNPLVKLTAEPIGTNCANGGVKIETGLDVSLNGVLEGPEIDQSQTQFICNGDNNVSGGNQIITSGSGVFTVPNNVSTIIVELYGAGGGGGSGGYTSCGACGISSGGGGGGSGGYTKSIINVSPGQQISYTVGIGGSSNQNGNNTVFGLKSALGGTKGGLGIGQQATCVSPNNGGAAGAGGNNGLTGGCPGGATNGSGPGGKGGNAPGQLSSGGAGGAGVNTYVNGNNGFNGETASGGGGGSGCVRNSSTLQGGQVGLGGNGGNGLIIISW